MRRLAIVAGLLASAGAARAADKPVYAPAPAWVRPVAVPAAAATGDDIPVRFLLTDQQVSFEPGRVTAYDDVAVRIGTSQGLGAGNLSLPWRPDTDELTIHKVVIHRGDKTIDVLAAGQTFTVVRRETNLESAMLDGVLTANIQPEGLQVGDVLEFAVSVTSHDPVMRQHAEYLGATWNGVPITHAHLRAQWPATLPVRVRQAGGLPALKPVRTGDMMSVEASLDNVVPLVLPKGAPPRFQIGRMAEMTTFASWADVAALLLPLYEKTAVLPGEGPLLTEVARIRAASADPRARAEAALALVQDRIRYVALAMGAGGMVPADTATTWSRRFGDCKGKTVLLIAILHSMGIAADPVVVSTQAGDGLDERLPRVGAFDHVLVRAVIAGRTYWLDGTRIGDTSLDRLTTPAFGWGLPLVARNAALVRMVPAPLDRPLTDLTIRIDATGGLMTPAPVTVESVMRGDAAIALGNALASLTGDARDRALRDYWKGQYDFIDVASTGTSYDARTGERRLSMTGKARMDWSSGWYETDGMGIGYRADFARDAGPDRDAPYAVAFPYYSRTVETILLPAGFPDLKTEGKNDIDRTVAGIEYRRRVKLTNGTFTAERSERTLAPEFPAKDAAAAQVALRDLADQRLYIRRPAGYRVTDADLGVWQQKTLASDDAYVDRGNVLLDRERYDEAIKDFDAALAFEPKNAYALANRGLAKVWKQDFAAANQDFAAAEKLDARNAVLWRARALEAETKDDAKGARAAYTTSLTTDPESSFALYGRARMNRMLGDTDAALADAAAAIARRPSLVEAYLFRANVLRGLGKQDAVAAEAKAVTAANPGDGYAHAVAGRLYEALGRHADAIAEFDRALAVKPEGYIYLNRMQSRPRTDRAGRAADVDPALKLDPKLKEALTARAALLTEANDLAGAISTYDAALTIQPDNTDLLLARGLARLRAGQTAAAERDLAAAHAQAKTPVQLNELCWTKATAGLALDSALADCDQALAQQPRTPAFLDSKALVLLRLKRTDEAIAAYDGALAMVPTLAGSLYGRGIAWTRKGDKTRGAGDIAAAMRLNPDVADEFAGYGVTP